MVPERGLEPPWIAPYAPEAYASTNFATRADSERTISKKPCTYKVFILLPQQCRDALFGWWVS